jgi:Trans-aconitate methyltransferase
MADWNPAQYLKFADERTQPSIDLTSRIRLQKKPHKILDIGCGPGNSTHILAQQFPHACIIGIDSSENMIQVAKSTSIDLEADLDFMICDAATGLPSLETDYDIVFSNAAIQWMPRHDELLRNMMGRLKPGGVMAVQTPLLEKHPLHRIIRGVTNREKYKGSFSKNIHRRNNLSSQEYAIILSDIAERFDIWETTYYHIMPSYRDILEWFRATRLRPYLAALSPDRVPEFEADLLDAFARSMPTLENGTILMPFPRLFFTAVR